MLGCYSVLPNKFRRLHIGGVFIMIQLLEGRRITSIHLLVIGVGSLLEVDTDPFSLRNYDSIL